MVAGEWMRYLNLARVVQNWFKVPSASTPSKRVFLICGLVDTAKRRKNQGFGKETKSQAATI